MVTNQLKPLDIIFTRTTSPLSWFIRMKTNSDWGHVCLVSQDTNVIHTPEGNNLFEILRTGHLGSFKLVPKDKYLKGKTYKIVRVPQLTDEQRSEGLVYLDQQVGQPYATKDLINLVQQNYKGSQIKRLEDNSPFFFCSEFVDFVFRQIGQRLSFWKDKDSSGMTPQDLEEHWPVWVVESNSPNVQVDEDVPA